MKAENWISVCCNTRNAAKIHYGALETSIKLIIFGSDLILDLIFLQNDGSGEKTSRAMIQPICLGAKDEGGRAGSGPEGGDRGQRRRGQIQHDSEVLQGYLHQGLQEDHRGGLLGETNRVSSKNSARKFTDDLETFPRQICSQGWQRPCL